MVRQAFEPDFWAYGPKNPGIPSIRFENFALITKISKFFTNFLIRSIVKPAVKFYEKSRDITRDLGDIPGYPVYQIL